MEDALECGAEDFVPEEEMFEVYTDPADLRSVADALTEKGYKYESAEVEKIPANYVTLTEEEHLVKMQKLLDALDDNDDVTQVYHNWE
jgi:transcriptional/translational regulatory protein YebC/TACO1